MRVVIADDHKLIVDGIKRYDATYLAVGLEGRVHAHRSCAHQLWLVCDRYRSLLGEIEDGLLDRATILQRRDELSAQVHAAYDQAFSLDQKAYESLRQPSEDGDRDQESSDEPRDSVVQDPVSH